MARKPSAPKELLAGTVELTEEPWDPDEAPELTEEHFERAAIYDGDRLIRRGRGRPKAAETKKLTSLRLDPAVVAEFRASGPGWQTRMNEVLKAHLKRQKGKAGSHASSTKPSFKVPTATSAPLRASPGTRRRRKAG